MANQRISSLKDGHAQVRGNLINSPQHGSAQKKEKRRASRSILDRIFSKETADLFTDIPLKIIRDAWFIGAHLLLDNDAHIVDMGCETGEMAYVLSHIKPDWKITAIDSDKQAIAFAKEHYKNKNLTFIEGDISKPDLKENSIDAIINSFVLHEVYSEAKFSTRKVRETLASHYKALKTDGFMFVRDYATQGPGNYVLMELKNEISTGDSLDQLSEADLLIWFSENVRSGDALTTGGFYLEELPARFPNTRLFRLPHKWAYEFILRKDDCALLEEDLDTEYTFATHRDLRRELRSIGARLLYCSSHWDDDQVKKNMIDHFKLYKENGDPLGYPETSYIMLVQKIKKQDSTRYQEWRTSRKKADSLTVESMRNNETGIITDIVSRHLDLTEIIPFYETPEGELKIFLQDNVPRSISNTVPRQGHNIDGREWSGHMIEALPFNTEDIDDIEQSKKNQVPSFIKDQLGLSISNDEKFIEGQTSYPDPKTINEIIHTKYVRVENTQNYKSLIDSNYTPPEGVRFNTVGELREYDAQTVLDGISVGLIPSARLEVQILKLFNRLKKSPKEWSESPLVLSEISIKDRLNIKDTLADMAEEKKRFSPVKTPAGNLRIIHSVFMEEGQDEQGGMTDISSREQDFFIPEEHSQNVAVVIPLAKDLNGEAMMGLMKEHAPVPERFKGNGTILNVPSFSLPSHIEDIESAKRYVAEMFEVDPKFVGKIGEPYFQHIGMTPKKVFPFAVTNDTGKLDYEHFDLTSYAPLGKIWDIMALVDCDDSFMKITALAYQRLLDENEGFSVDHDFSKDLYAQHTSSTTYESDFLVNSTPSRASTNKKPQVS